MESVSYTHLSDLHTLREIDGRTIGQIDAKALFQLRTTVRKTILDNEVLRLLCVDKRCDVGTL